MGRDDCGAGFRSGNNHRNNPGCPPIARKVAFHPAESNVTSTPERKLNYSDYAAIPEDGKRYEVLEGS